MKKIDMEDTSGIFRFMHSFNPNYPLDIVPSEVYFEFESAEVDKSSLYNLALEMEMALKYRKKR